MKRIIFLAALASPLLVFAQVDNTVQKEKMKVFACMPGTWTGEGRLQGSSSPSQVTEHFSYRLDSTVLLLEGQGTVTDSATQAVRIVHEALGILSYDPAKADYNLRSYIRTGQSTDAWFHILDDAHFQWGFDAGRGKIRYTITVDRDHLTWDEQGEYSADGTNWSPFFHMALHKER